MKSYSIKLKAEIVDSYYGAKSKAFTVSVCFLKLFFMISTIFCASALIAFVKSELYGNDIINDTLYSLLFVAGIVFSVCFYILSDYILKSEFLKTTLKKDEFKLFDFINIKLQLKIIYLYLVKYTVNLFKTILYLLPAAVCGLSTVYFVKDGIDRQLFAALCLLFTVLFVSGAFFAFCSCQRLAFSAQTVFLNKTKPVSEIIRITRSSTDGKCFAIARFKLSFSIRFLLCIFIVPFIFVAPHYYRCISLYAIKTLGVKVPRSASEKPVILMLPVKIKGA